MPRKPNYGFEKRRKELDRQAKKDEKLRRKRENASDASEEPKAPAADDQSVPPSE